MAILWSEPALDDLRRVEGVYGADTELARRAEQRILAAVERIARYPKIGTLHRGRRHRRVSGAPFHIFWRETRDDIRILRILHVRSNWVVLA